MSGNTKIYYAVGSALVVGYLSYLGILCATILAVVVGFGVFKVKSLLEVPELPKLEETWWGSREASQEDTSIKEFKVQVSDDVLQDLKNRLEKARPFTPALENSAQEYGMNATILSEIVSFWKTEYNWKERENFLNQYPQHTVSVQGLRMHYIHVKPTDTQGKRVIVLMLVHGWPGSVREFYSMVPILTKPQEGSDFVFELIIPSLPGYGFSEGTTKTGLGPPQMAVILKNLMKRIGFDRFYIQGGDWGSVIVQHMATLFPENIIGVHSNLAHSMTLRAKFLIVLGMVFPQLVVDDKYRSRMYPSKYNYEETGYAHFHATKPDTIGFALNDSPVGLAAYILEKFVTWADPKFKQRVDGGVKEKWTYTDLLDNVMIYWITGCMTTSIRLYKEHFQKIKEPLRLERIPIKVPGGAARFSNDIFYHTDIILKDKYQNLVHSSDNEGGHFAAFELPNVLAKDIIEFVKKAEAFHKKQI